MTSQKEAYRAVNTILVQRNWLIGYRIAEEELGGDNRAEYGANIIKKLSKELTEKYGKGFTKSNLYSFYSFYKTYPKIFQTTSGKSEIQLSWSHYAILSRILDSTARKWYENEAIRETWSVRTLQRNVQKDFNDNMHYDKNEVTAEILISTLKTAGIPAEKIIPELVDTFKEELVSAGVMNVDNILKGSPAQITKIFDEMLFVNETLHEHAEVIKKQFKELMVQKGTKKIEIRNGDNEPYENKVRAYVTEGEFEKIYLGLRQNLMKRTIYKFKLDKDKFIDDCILEINNKLKFMRAKNEYKVETGKAKFNDSQMFVMEETHYGDQELEIEISSEPKSDFEIANYIMYHTMIPRLAIFKILQGVEKRELLNNQDILDVVTQLIREKLDNAKAENITSYEVINGYEIDSRNIFELDSISEADFEESWRVFHAKSDRSSAMNEYYKMDSEGECEFAHRLENNSNVLLFTKLKKGGFVIDTPYGNYSPDWAVVCKKESLSDPSIGIYFIVESKWGKAGANLQDVERNKIKCGKLHFEAVSEQVKFDWIKSYEDFKQKFGVAEGSDSYI